MTREFVSDNRSRIFAVPALLLVLPLLLAAPATDADVGAREAMMTSADTATFAIRDVRLFDGREVRNGVTVVVRDGRIAAVGLDVAVPDGVQVISGEGRTLLPGLIDAHVHTYPTTRDPDNALRQALVFGVTTELDMGSDPDTIARLRDEQRRGEAIERADLFAAGWMATASRGDASDERSGLEGIPTLDGPGDAGAWVEAQAEKGADHIKIVYEDGAAFNTSMPTLSPTTVERLVEETHRRDLLAVTHVSSLQGARVALEADSDVLAHTWMDSVPDPALARRMADGGVAAIPTLSVLESLAGREGGASLAADPRLEPYLLPGIVRDLGQSAAEMVGREPAPETFDTALTVVSRLHAAGVPILAGTDARSPGTAHGPSLHRELELLVEAGLTPEGALAAATSVPAETFGLEDRGRVKEGVRADLLLLEGDPTEDVAATRAIVAVWKEGRRVNREAFSRRAAEAHQERPAPEDSESGLISGF